MFQLLEQFSIFTSLIFLIFLIIWLFFTLQNSSKKLPPSPPKLPILGNLHQLGIYPHYSLLSMARKHGPMMLLQLGSKPTLVVSSADGAREVMKTHDLVFANRPVSTLAKKLLYDCKDVSAAPYGEYWRQLKSNLVLQLLSNSKVQSIRGIRKLETDLLVNRVIESAASESEVNLSELLLSLTNGVVCRAALGGNYNEGEKGQKFRELMHDVVGLLGRFDVGSFIPWLAWTNRLNGFDSEVNRVAKEIDEFLEMVVQDHSDRAEVGVGGCDGSKEEDFVDGLLKIYRDSGKIGFSIDRDSIKAMILDVFSAGTDTTYTLSEWVMTQLLRNPRVMKELQKEVRGIVQANGSSLNDVVSENDLERMHYLKAVIKETLRLHPPVPLLVPRAASKDIKIMGYDVAAGTMAIINALAIGRDPSLWDEPEEFRPERFLNSSIDFRGRDFELIPFGAGRRGCPGISFAMATNEFVVATLVNMFDWELPSGMKPEDLDFTECTGLTIRRKVPLMAVATPCSC